MNRNSQGRFTAKKSTKGLARKMEAIGQQFAPGRGAKVIRSLIDAQRTGLLPSSTQRLDRISRRYR